MELPDVIWNASGGFFFCLKAKINKPIEINTFTNVSNGYRVINVNIRHIFFHLPIYGIKVVILLCKKGLYSPYKVLI